ncbi:MAG TPA: hypothetical protein VM736_03210 [Gemmatimonadales bacterium]|nr:hypothetical protein [Gemmatimonadales bacterium]
MSVQGVDVSESGANKNGGPARSIVGRRGYPLRRIRSVLYNDAEWHAVEEAARLHGKAPRVFVREVSLGTLPPARPGVLDAPLVRELGQSGTALARLAATARASGALPQAATLEAALAELLALVRRIASERGGGRRS